MKRFLFVKNLSPLMIFIFGCNFLDCENLRVDFLEGSYRNKQLPNQLIIINKDGTYHFKNTDKGFDGSWYISDVSHCEISFNNWKDFNKGDSKCLDGCTNTVIVNKDQLIFDVDNYDNNYYKVEK